MTESSIPEWAVDLFQEYARQLNADQHFVWLSMVGLIAVRAMPPDELQLFYEFNDPAATSLGTPKQRARMGTRFVNTEVSKGFPTLNAQVTVALWSSLEAFIRNFLSGWLINVPGAYDVEAVKRIKIPLSEYQALSTEERAAFVIEVLERETSASLKQGITRFEVLLDAFGLGGSVDDSVGRHIFELSQVRNVLVHRHGTVDKRLCAACPWMNLVPGSRLMISPSAYEGYDQAVGDYADTVFRRAARKLGHEVPPQEELIALGFNKPRRRLPKNPQDWPIRHPADV